MPRFSDSNWTTQRVGVWLAEIRGSSFWADVVKNQSSFSPVGQVAKTKTELLRVRAFFWHRLQKAVRTTPPAPTTPAAAAVLLLYWSVALNANTVPTACSSVSIYYFVQTHFDNLAIKSTYYVSKFRNTWKVSIHWVSGAQQTPDAHILFNSSEAKRNLTSTLFTKLRANILFKPYLEQVG